MISFTSKLKKATLHFLLKIILISFIQITFSLESSFAEIGTKSWSYDYSKLSLCLLFFQPGSDWDKSSLIVNGKSETTFGSEYRIRYEYHSSEKLSYKMGINIQNIRSSDLAYEHIAFAFELVDELIYRKNYQFSTILSFAYAPAPLSTVSAKSYNTDGQAFRGELIEEFSYNLFTHWPVKLGVGYYYQKLMSFDATPKINPSYMNLNGILLYIGISYKF